MPPRTGVLAAAFMLFLFVCEVGMVFFLSHKLYFVMIVIEIVSFLSENGLFILTLMLPLSVFFRLIITFPIFLFARGLKAFRFRLSEGRFEFQTSLI